MNLIDKTDRIFRCLPVERAGLHRKVPRKLSTVVSLVVQLSEMALEQVFSKMEKFQLMKEGESGKSWQQSVINE